MCNQSYEHKIGVCPLNPCAILIRARETAAIITNALDAGTAWSALPVRKDTSDAYCTDTGYAVSQFVFSAHPDLFLSLCRKAPYLGDSNPGDWLIWPYHHDTLFLSIRAQTWLDPGKSNWTPESRWRSDGLHRQLLDPLCGYPFWGVAARGCTTHFCYRPGNSICELEYDPY